jgi:hypothetical protein
MTRPHRGRHSSPKGAPPGDLVVAIDEAGDFRADSDRDHFFVAAIVRPGKEEQYRRWEHGVPGKERKDGEVKGGYLSDDRLHDFVREVLAAEPRVRIVRIAIQPSLHEPGVIAKHQTDSVALAEAKATEFERSGHRRAALEVRGHARWLAAMKQGQYLKVALQTMCVARSLSHTVAHAISGGYDFELPTLRYKIDRGLIDDDPVKRRYWRRMVAMQARRLPEDERVVSLDTWEVTGHPFLDLYRAGPEGPEGWNFGPLFNNRCDFLGSLEHYEIRIADIVASIHRSYFGTNRKERKSVYERIARAGLFTFKGAFSKLLLDPTAPLPSP